MRTRLMAKSLTRALPSLFFLGAPLLALAHEVYVLEEETFNTLREAEPLPLLQIVMANLSDTLIWGGIIGFLIISIFLISISVTLENKFDRHLIRLKHFAPFIARVTAGLAFLFCAYYGALFGPELPLSIFFGSWAFIARLVLAATGLMMLFGFHTRLAGLIGIGFFSIGVAHYGTYMLTYTNYFAEMIVLLLVGGHRLSVKEHPSLGSVATFFQSLTSLFGEFSFLILRVGFGISLIYASLYAKVIHNQLALAVVHEYHLVDVFGFNAEFILLGAAIIEILLGVFIILGIEIRFNAVVLNIFLTLSLIYFGEAVWPHIILIGIPIAFFCYGYDKYSLEGYFFKKGNREPIF